MRIKQKEQEMMKKLTIDAKVIDEMDDGAINSPPKQPVQKVMAHEL